MGSHRGSRLGSSLLAAALVLVAAATTVRAQPGFGPDPFWPYNNQYTPYVTNAGPATPQGGQGGAMNMRNGLRNANQFQNYLESIEGPGRNRSDRAGVGMPYYRSAVDPTYESRDRRPRQYQPNALSNENFEESQRKVADVYFRYYSERDPAARARLLGELREARRDAAIATSGRGRSSSRPRGSSPRTESNPRRGARTDAAAPRPGAVDRSRDAVDRFGPAPEVPPIATRRSAAPRPRGPLRSDTSAAPRSRGPLPSDILDRSRAMDRESGVRPSSGSPALSPRPRSRGVAPRPPTPPATDPGTP